MHTVESAKAQLPDVLTRQGNKTITCQIAGRKERFASIWTGNAWRECAWETIAYSLNTGTPIRLA